MEPRAFGSWSWGFLTAGETGKVPWCWRRHPTSSVLGGAGTLWGKVQVAKYIFHLFRLQSTQKVELCYCFWSPRISCLLVPPRGSAAWSAGSKCEAGEFSYCWETWELMWVEVVQSLTEPGWPSWAWGSRGDGAGWFQWPAVDHLRCIAPTSPSYSVASPGANISLTSRAWIFYWPNYWNCTDYWHKHLLMCKPSLLWHLIKKRQKWENKCTSGTSDLLTVLESVSRVTPWFCIAGKLFNSAQETNMPCESPEGL